MNSIVIYPRGFSGYDIGLPMTDDKKDINKIIESIRYNKKFSTAKDSVASNYEVEKLFKQLLEGRRFIKSFEFRENILKAGLTAFGTMDFKDWCLIQEKSPFFSDIHKRYIHDTFNFLITGTRVMDPLSWMQIIELKEITKNDSYLKYDIEQYFNLNKPLTHPKRRQTDLISTIQRWVSNENGFQDFLISLHIFFGSEEKDVS